MSKHVESVKGVWDFLTRFAEIHRENGHEHRASKLEGHAQTLKDACDHIASLEAMTSALPPDLGNLNDLPDALLAELSITKTDTLEDQLVTVINAHGGAASLDQILVGLYRKFGVSQKRRFIQNKLYRMTMVWSVPGKKGVYSTEEPQPQASTDLGEEVVLVEDVDDIPGRTSESMQEEEDEEIPF